MNAFCSFLVSLTIVLISCHEWSQSVLVSAERNSLGQEIYDIDASWAIKSNKLSNALGDKQAFYNSFIQGCRKAAGTPSKAHAACDAGEDNRIKMNNRQPMSMRNYTKNGFLKIKAPAKTFKLIKDFWDANRDRNETEWRTVNTYHNMWDSPPTLIDIQDPGHGGGPELSNAVWESARQTLEEWTGMHLSPCSIWGVRIYSNNSILTPHVDRNPLITSAIINVDQDVDEPWPLEVWGHDGIPYNVTMEPGDMVLYESHTIIHGRPFAMRGRFFANIFVHFEPLGTPRKPHDDFSSPVVYDAEALESMDAGLPPYVIPGTPWEDEWHSSFPDGWKLLHNDVSDGASKNDLRLVDNLYIKDPQSIHSVDTNGWSPLHEAARAGSVDVAKYLFERDVDINLKTGHGVGDSALDLARQYHGEDSEIFKFLFGVGAESGSESEL